MKLFDFNLVWCVDFGLGVSICMFVVLLSIVWFWGLFCVVLCSRLELMLRFWIRTQGGEFGILISRSWFDFDVVCGAGQLPVMYCVVLFFGGICLVCCGFLFPTA